MTVALVLDFPDGTRAKYDEVVERMHLDGRMAPGGVVHVAGSYGGAWRVIDVWEDLEHFTRFRDEQIVPHIQAVGMSPPTVRVVEVDEVMAGNGKPSAFVQCVLLPGIDRKAFRAAHEEIVPGGEAPAGLTFHVNGPIEDGWCVIDGWTSKQARDEFLDARVRPVFATAPLTGAPAIEDLDVEASLTERPATATAAS
jgi:quinol monooxygenase YgiN